MPRQELVPGEITRLLSRHGPVKLMVGDPERGDIATANCAIVPYEDCLYLFASRTGRIVEALNTSCMAEVTASAPAKEDTRAYAITLRGRALVGPALSVHPRRLEFASWMPEGASTAGLCVVQMWTERLEFIRGDDEFFGHTPASVGLPRSSTRWFSTGLGNSWPLLGFGLAMTMAYLAWTDDPWRVIPVALASVVLPCWIAGPELWYRAMVFGEWQRGRKPLESAGMIGEALLPVGRVLGTAITLHVLGLLAFLPLFWFTPDVPGIVFFGSFIWFSWPVVLTRVVTAEKAKKEN